MTPECCSIRFPDTHAFDFFSKCYNDSVIGLHYCKYILTGTDWPLYFPDLTPCEFFFRVHEGRDLSPNPQNIEEIEQYMGAVCETIPHDIFAKLHAIFVLRLLWRLIWKYRFLVFKTRSQRLLVVPFRRSIC